MSDVAVALVITAGGFLASIGGSLLIAGVRWGRVIERLDALVDGQKANTVKVDDLGNRVSRIEGMLTPTTVQAGDPPHARQAAV